MTEAACAGYPAFSPLEKCPAWAFVVVGSIRRFRLAPLLVASVLGARDASVGAEPGEGRGFRDVAAALGLNYSPEPDGDEDGTIPGGGSPEAGGLTLLDIDNNGRLDLFRDAHVGFVFQSFNLLEHLTALKNAALPMLYRGLGRRESRRRARDILEKVGMGDRLDRRPDRLSGGQKQRAAIARALVGKPAVALADEPTGALDSDTAEEVMNLPIRPDREGRVAVAIVTRDPAISTQCRRRTPVRDGILLEDGAGA